VQLASLEPQASPVAQPVELDIFQRLTNLGRRMVGLQPAYADTTDFVPPSRLGGPRALDPGRRDERGGPGVRVGGPAVEQTTAPQTLVPLGPPPPPPPMQRGETSDRVRDLQVLLKELGLLNEAPNSTFGRTTERAIIDFQAQYTGADGQQLQITGVVDPMTMAALKAYKRYREQQRRNPASQPLPDDLIRVEPSFESVGSVQVLRANAKGPEVARAQNLLRALGYDIQVTEVFDEPTRAAVSDFQQLYSFVMGVELEPDGVLGPNTGTAMALAAKRTRESPMNFVEFARRYREANPRPTPPAPGTEPGNQPVPPVPVSRPTPSLRPGSADRAAVQELQQQLRALGYDITADSDFGPATTAALTDFQRLYTMFSGEVLVADGVLNDATRNAMLNARRNGTFDRLPEPLRRGQIETGYVRGVPNTIVVRSLGDGSTGRLETRAALAYFAMRASAQREGGTFQAGSSFRTQQRQRELAIEYRNQPGRAARPGYSTHQSGIAIDTENVNGAADRWLRANGRRYGFVLPGYVYTGANGEAQVEEWHWEYRVDRLPNAVRRYYGLPELAQDPSPTAGPSAPTHQSHGRSRRTPPQRSTRRHQHR
jgi:peptidoglycan hydrolase-like protein with peptidoglycan-binding domain